MGAESTSTPRGDGGGFGGQSGQMSDRPSGRVGLAVQPEPELMVPDLRSVDRMGAIKEMVDRLYRAGCVTDSLSFLQSVLAREALESTVVGDGVALPHARSRSATRLGMAVGLSRAGVDFQSGAKDSRIYLVCLLAVPVLRDEGYLSCLGVLAGLFQDTVFRSGLRACRTHDEMCKHLSGGLQKGNGRSPARQMASQFQTAVYSQT
jgi:mannitol/fructose-specific phosphotransferase system IIA component (Ntr-type)